MMPSTFRYLYDSGNSDKENMLSASGSRESASAINLKSYWMCLC